MGIGPMLWETKSNKPRVTFLHAIVEIAERAALDSISFIEQLEDLPKAAR